MSTWTLGCTNLSSFLAHSDSQCSANCAAFLFSGWNGLDFIANKAAECTRRPLGLLVLRVEGPAHSKLL